LDWIEVLGMRLWRGIWWVETRREAGGVRLSGVIVSTVTNGLVVYKYVLIGKREDGESFV
jgi:hypothetical protein